MLCHLVTKLELTASASMAQRLTDDCVSQWVNCVIYEITWKNIVEADRPQMTIYYNACALHAGCLRLQTHTQCL